MIGKILKWAGAYFRLLGWKLRLGSRLKTGKRVYIGKHCHLQGNITLEDGVYLSDYCVLQAEQGGAIHVGSQMFMNTDCKIYAMERIEIGEGSMFGSNVSVYDHDHDISKGVAKAGKTFVVKPVWIEDHVWCGTNSVITKGTRIGENCVLGAGGVAGGTLEPDGLYVGVPAVRKRDIPRE